MLGLFSAVAALVQVYGGPRRGIGPAVARLAQPVQHRRRGRSAGTRAPWPRGCSIALFIYWGWDTTATVNEESGNPTEQPGRATIIATVVLVATYVIVTIAALALHGRGLPRRPG